MASFESWMLPHKRRYRRIIAGYQDLPNDSGNWSSGKTGVGTLIGTNRSIAAPTLIDWRGRMVTKQEMMDLSIQESMQIYKAKFWDAIQGDRIQSQELADIICDMKSSAGGNAIKVMQRILNSHGEQLSVDGSFKTSSVDALNRQIQKVGVARLFNEFRDGMIEYYYSINNPYEKQLIGSLNEDYPPMSENPLVKYGAVIVFSSIALLLAGWGIYEYMNIEPAKGTKKVKRKALAK